MAKYRETRSDAQLSLKLQYLLDYLCIAFWSISQMLGRYTFVPVK
ncbi:hypothetical protein [Chitinophaga sp. CF418]|nr:hypothetical protein [Chitinophaga sp. CF418]